LDWNIPPNFRIIGIYRASACLTVYYLATIDAVVRAVGPRDVGLRAANPSSAPAATGAIFIVYGGGGDLVIDQSNAGDGSSRVH
jgi:hypothetical protein